MKSSALSTLVRFGEFAASLTFDGIPERCRRLAVCQVASIAAAWGYGFRSKAVRKVAEGFGCRLPAAEEFFLPRGANEEAVLGTLCAASMVDDFDDYLFLGHTGHSAVACALLSRPESGEELITRIVIGNELGGRVGGSVFFGPHNGQLWSYVHLAAAAAIRGRSLGLDGRGIAHALAIAFSQVPFPLAAAFMGYETKLLTAAIPAMQGWRAAGLAKAGATGNLDLFEDPGGFFAEIPFVPLPSFATGLSEAWLTDTITFKRHPGCAYLGPVLDCLEEIRQGGAIEAGEVSCVDIEATFLTVEMDQMAQAGEKSRERLDPVLVGFSVKDAVALDILHGGLRPANLRHDALGEATEAARKLASKVRLTHDFGLSVDLLKSVTRTLPLGKLLATFSRRELLRLRREMRRRHGKTLAIGPAALVRIARCLSAGDGLAVSSWLLGRLLSSSGRRDDFDLGACDFSTLELPIGARVCIREKDGRIRKADVRRPEGSPGTEHRFDIPREKLARSLENCKQADSLQAEILGLPDSFSGSLLRGANSNRYDRGPS